MNVSGDSYPSFKLTEKTSSPLPRKLDAQGNSFHPRTKPRRRVKLHRLPEPKETQPHSLCSQSWWPPPTRTAPQATVPCRTRPSPPTVRASRRAAPAAGRRAGRGRRLPGLAGARTPITGSHEEPGRHALAQPRGPAPRPAILLHSRGRPGLPPPPPARPPSPSVRIGWRPGRRHFPTAHGACGSPAALQARPWPTARPIRARGVGRGGG